MRGLPGTLLLVGVLALAAPSLPRAAPGADSGSLAPDFELKDTGGKSLRLSSLRGEVVVLHFWATWCPHCLSEMPLLEDLAREESGRGVRVVAVNLGEPASRVRKYLRDHRLDLTVLLDSRGRVAADYGVIGLPASVVLDSSGRVAERISMGSLDREGLKRILATLLERSDGEGSSP